MTEPVVWRIEIECDGGPYVEHWDASRKERAQAQYEEALALGEIARLIPLYAHPATAMEEAGEP